MTRRPAPARNTGRGPDPPRVLARASQGRAGRRDAADNYPIRRPVPPGRRSQAGHSRILDISAATQDRASRSSERLTEQTFGKSRALEILLCVSVSVSSEILH
jgi:hypothetical protein